MKTRNYANESPFLLCFAVVENIIIIMIVAVACLIILPLSLSFLWLSISPTFPAVRLAPRNATLSFLSVVVGNSAWVYVKPNLDPDQLSEIALW